MASVLTLPELKAAWLPMALSVTPAFIFMSQGRGWPSMRRCSYCWNGEEQRAVSIYACVSTMYVCIYGSMHMPGYASGGWKTTFRNH